MKLHATFVVLVIAIGAVVAMGNGTAAPVCPPDGDDSLWPTFEVTEKCGSYDECTALSARGQLKEAKACNEKIDACGETLVKTNQKADAHNAELEDCRSTIWSTVVKPAEQ